MPVATVKSVVAPPDAEARNRSLTYGDLGSYVLKNEISVDGPLREYYLRAFSDTASPDEWETEIGWSIFLTA